MKYRLILLFLVFTSCGHKTEIIKCDSDLSHYSAFDYEILEKEFINEVNGDSVFSAEILIKTFTKDSMILMDSVSCFCLAICKKESIAEARFYKNKIGFEIAKKYQINEFSIAIATLYIDNNIDMQNLLKHSIASIRIDDIDQNWTQHLNSNNFSVFGLRQVQPLEGEYVERKLVIE